MSSPATSTATAIDAARIEEAGLNALQTQRQLFYDGWILRLSPGSAKRARSVNAHFASSLPIGQKIAYCESTYARCSLPTIFRLTPFCHPGNLDELLHHAGYVAFDQTLVQAMLLDAPPAAADLDDESEVRTVDPASFAEAVGALRGSSAVQREAHLERLRASPLVSRMVVVRVRDAIVAAAQMAGEGDIVGLFDVVTAPDARRRGYARAAVAALFAWAYERAFATVYLQVNASNAAAIALYRALGFSTVYTYHYRGRPGACE
ncbi:MAG TPA: GNAT family N-acetyltransferase [Casimicrobiaceae bacterium]|nr:GNAT family N-acetyltransferase [Casimicrobiaceae bacterium]